MSGSESAECAGWPFDSQHGKDEMRGGKWISEALKSCPLPGYGYEVKAHALDGAVWPVALFVSENDARSVCDPDGWEKRYQAVERLKDDRAEAMRHLALILEVSERNDYAAYRDAVREIASAIWRANPFKKAKRDAADTTPHKDQAP